MSSHEQRVLAVVRRKVISGGYLADERISEVAIAEELGVSRTPARLALAALEAEGLIEKRQGRGYSVRPISTESVSNAIAVRAALEALAARTMAERGMSGEVEARLAASIARTAAILHEDDPGPDPMSGYHAANIDFHEAIMTGCGNDLIAHAYERIRHLPFAALGTLAFEPTLEKRDRIRLSVGHSQHVIILDALRRRDAARAEAMMREHSHATLNYADLFVT
ncbi:FCD domain-containing protein [Aquibium sp. ELW1220]|uniref:FCD domain-containing protein n=1 Tax=Aquibium sp. ELW1220 TaxID=2976766 RepID=UPI0025B26A80|nr:FCD domain-containing protein [Aquibium sp. ELW1220]MDN2579037.1 FCD domain-containing protein [Aquibium sp. ELW1220]